MNENYQQPGDAGGRGAGIIKGMYQLRDGEKSKGKTPRVQLLGSGTIFREVIAAADLLKNDWGVDADIWSCPSHSPSSRATATVVTRVEHAAPDRQSRACRTSRRCLKDTQGPVIAATDYMRAFADQIRAARSAPLRRARHRRLRPLRHAREAASFLRGRPATTSTVAALKALADDGTIPAAKVAEAIAKYGLDPDKPAPWTV